MHYFVTYSYLFPEKRHITLSLKQYKTGTKPEANNASDGKTDLRNKQYENRSHRYKVALIKIHKMTHKVLFQ